MTENLDRFKFRLWHIKAELMEDIGFGVDAWVINNTTEYIVMQCTGLKDKNGNLIFEGDILQETIQREITCTGKLIGLFSINGYPSQILEYAIDEIGAHFKFNLGLAMSECVIIGNIYENLELLNK